MNNQELVTRRPINRAEQGNDGKATVTYKDVNKYSTSYNTTKQETVSDTSNCPVPNTNPNWVEQSRVCNKVNGQNDGTATVTYKDTNVYSSSYNTTKQETVTDLTNCPLPSKHSATFTTYITNSNGSVANTEIRYYLYKDNASTTPVLDGSTSNLTTAGTYTHTITYDVVDNAAYYLIYQIMVPTGCWFTNIAMQSGWNSMTTFDNAHKIELMCSNVGTSISNFTASTDCIDTAP